MLLRLDALPRWLRDFAPLILWMGLIFFLSAQPTLVGMEDDIKGKIIYKTAHVIAYAVLVWLWWRAWSPQRRLSWATVLPAFILTVLYGASDEIHQLFVPGRHGRLADVLIDTGGALLMLFLLYRVTWLRSFPEVIPASDLTPRDRKQSKKFFEVKE